MLILNKINLLVKILFYQIIQFIFKRRVNFILKLNINLNFRFQYYAIKH